jgi:hypothetical protein
VRTSFSIAPIPNDPRLLQLNADLQSRLATHTKSLPPLSDTRAKPFLTSDNFYSVKQQGTTHSYLCHSRFALCGRTSWAIIYGHKAVCSFRQQKSGIAQLATNQTNMLDTTHGAPATQALLPLEDFWAQCCTRVSLLEEEVRSPDE